MTDSPRLRLGRDLTGQDIRLDLGTETALIIGGATSGKTHLCHRLVAELSTDCDVEHAAAHADRRRLDEHNLDHRANIEVLAARLRIAVARMWSNATLAAHTVPWLARPRPLLLIVDGLSDYGVPPHALPGLFADLNALARVGPRLGVTLVVTTQRWDSRLVTLAAAVQHRLYLGRSEPRTASFLFGDRDHRREPEHGTGWWAAQSPEPPRLITVVDDAGENPASA